MLDFIFSPLSILLAILGLCFSFLASVFGNVLPLNLAIMQVILPQTSFGILVGTAKAGGIVRGIGMILSVYKKINLKIISWILPQMLIGAIIGVSFIAHLNSKWIFPTLIIAYFIAEFSGKIAHKIPQKAMYLPTFLAGIYMGFLGAGMRSILVSFLRLKFPDDSEIAILKIHASFMTWAASFLVVIGHYSHGNIVWDFVGPFAFGCFFGGVLGGQMLKNFTLKSPKIQKWLMRSSFGIGILVSGYLFFQEILI